MNEKLQVLLREIEGLRIKLQALFRKSHSFQDPEVLEASRKLDEALNEYERVLREKAREE